jgi:hypothetical protein
MTYDTTSKLTNTDNISAFYIYLDPEERSRFNSISYDSANGQISHTNFAMHPTQHTLDTTLTTQVVPVQSFLMSIVTILIDVIKGTNAYDIYNYLFA